MAAAVAVHLSDRSYSIQIGVGLLETLGESIESLQLGKKCAVITNNRVGPLYRERVLQSL